MSDKGADFKTETVVHQTCKRNGESKTKQSTKENSNMQTYENEEMIVPVNAIYAIAQGSLKKNSPLQRGLNP